MFRSLIVVTALLFGLGINEAYADWGRHHHRYHGGHSSFGLHVSILPATYSSVWVGGVRYYYHNGDYYLPDGPGYVVVNPPIGTLVSTIPAAQYQPVIINGVTYYVNNGVYYVYTPYGYQLVPQPANVVSTTTVTTTTPAVTAPASAPAVAPQTVNSAVATAAQDDAFTVNIPNEKGGYTPVVLKKTDTGFVGPQGEFYAEFPKVAQLKAMYGK